MGESACLLLTDGTQCCVQGSASAGSDAMFELCVCVAGLTWEECIAQCPQGVVPACHNAEDTVTISGPQVTRFPGFSQYSTSLLYLSFMYYITHVITVTLSLIYSQIQ